MWSRSIIKSNAKAALRGKYPLAFLACAAVSVLTLLLSIITSKFQSEYIQMSMSPNLYLNEVIQQSSTYSLISILNILYMIFIGFPIIIGLSRFFVRNRFGETKIKNIFSGFKRGWINSVGAMFVTYLFITLWLLLFIIPGVVKWFEYCMVKYILSDNPNLTGSRARQISRMMTDGQKGSIFVLILSFAGWYILAITLGAMVGAVNKTAGSVVCYIGFLFIEPYVKASFAELYIFLRDRAIKNNFVSPYELGLAPAE